MKEKKEGRGKIVVIVLLTLLLIGNCSYIAYDHFFASAKKEAKEEKKTTKKKEKEVEKRDLSLAEEKILLDQIKEYNLYLADLYPIQDIKKTENQTKLLFAYYHLEEKNKEEVMQGDIQKIVNSYFGEDNGVSYESIQCPIDGKDLYQYDQTTRIYTYVDDHQHSGSGFYNTHNYFIDGSVYNEEEFVINVHVIYEEYCKSECGPSSNYYKTAKDAFDLENAIIEKEEEEEFSDGDYEKVKSQLPTTTYTFIKDKDGNYGLRKVEIK